MLKYIRIVEHSGFTTSIDAGGAVLIRDNKFRIKLL